MKCVLCDQRKAKRPCPAKNSPICAQCCGEKRVLGIDCPESCGYLQSGRQREMEDYAKRVRSMDPAGLEKRQRLFREQQDTLAQIEYAVARERLSNRNLVDKDVLDAVEILLETYKTEDKGVLYEKTSEDLLVDALRREIKKVIESLRTPDQQEGRGIVDPGSTRLQLGAAIECLEFIHLLAESYA
jgi:DNA-binding TFAR19-related protein (PDSD5 family)